ncbi:cryptochrome/photolyase family protein [Asticcacaulis sp. 201]|uniref:cryptochrome/photolyase family protein n=1 Tax=Asticcacaulis sp. 201 TaxID=3028787 RepID=UPI0029163C43|nr:cryptochrome/photolyase family protein [Asticcacaulis sp. 201]MDV6331020.1 cryptochrome/photolyase family protein [Asticcacaulis sp. 201]
MATTGPKPAGRVGAVRLILADQLSSRLPILMDADKQSDVILMAEVMAEATYVRHHVKKIAFLFSAMRHFAEALRRAGFNVRYVTLDDPQNRQTLSGEIERAVECLAPQCVAVTEPGEWRLKEAFKALERTLSVPLHNLPDTRFLCSHERFAAWAEKRQSLRMEFFYREMRRDYGILMEPDGQPTGGKWNYDADNRQPPNPKLKGPRRLSFKKDDITRAVLDLVRERFPDGFGVLEPFHFAVTRTQALRELKHFIADILPDFGDHQDAMIAGEPYLYHSLLSAYLNAGLLYPLEICQAAEAAYRQGHVPLNAAEGFIRQILGWREFIRGIYWRFMPGYAQHNGLDAQEPLPWLYWSGETKMACMREAIAHTRQHAYSHHIQRLMITGNFALIAGLRPADVHDWYLSVYADAYEWVELPNTLGMALHADGGIVGSKPYAASGNYINRMSNYCADCTYNPKLSVGESACPFNALYWDFLARHRSRFAGNPRLPYVYATWDKMGEDKRMNIRSQAQAHLRSMRQGSL